MKTKKIFINYIFYIFKKIYKNYIQNYYEIVQLKLNIN